MTDTKNSRTSGSRFGGQLPTPQAMRSFAGRIFLNAVVPLAVYLAVLPYVHSDLTALVVGAAVPVVYTVAVLIVRRRLDPIGLLAVAGFCFGLFMLFVTGDNELVFKLRREIWTGPLGLLCLLSVPARRPLLLVAMRLAARRNSAVAARLRVPGAERIATAATLAVGAILLVHAIVLVVVAMNTSTATFLIVSKPISWVIGIGALLPLIWWIRRDRRRHPDADQP